VSQETISVSVPAPADVGRLYDDYAALCDVTVGENLHFGYWDTPDSGATLAEAAHRLTDVLADRLALTAGQRLLDVGCGVGGPTVRIARRTGAQVTGISISKEQIIRAAAHAELAGMADRVTFQHANAIELPFPAESFDAVIALESLIHVPDREQVLGQIRNVLRPGGRLVLTDFYERTPIPAAKLPAVQRYLRDFLFTIVQPGDYIPLLQNAGLRFIEILDISAQSVRQTFTHLSAQLTEEQRKLGTEFGADMVDKFNPANMIDVHEFGHLLIVAERPA
jgi:cyclopropane fatty-acyl-phospholipid synthase-like methyltransferase